MPEWLKRFRSRLALPGWIAFAWGAMLVVYKFLDFAGTVEFAAAHRGWIAEVGDVATNPVFAMSCLIVGIGWLWYSGSRPVVAPASRPVARPRAAPSPRLKFPDPAFEFKAEVRFAMAAGQRSLPATVVLRVKAAKGIARGCVGRIIEIVDRGYDVNARYVYRPVPLSEHLPVYLQWAAENGGGRECDVTPDATLELLSLASPTGYLQLLTADVALREKYRVDISCEFVVEVVDAEGRSAEYGLQLNTSPLLHQALKGGPPILGVDTSQYWLERQLKRVAAAEAAFRERQASS